MEVLNRAKQWEKGKFSLYLSWGIHFLCPWTSVFLVLGLSDPYWDLHCIPHPCFQVFGCRLNNLTSFSCFFSCKWVCGPSCPPQLCALPPIINLFLYILLVLFSWRILMSTGILQKVRDSKPAIEGEGYWNLHCIVDLSNINVNLLLLYLLWAVWNTNFLGSLCPWSYKCNFESIVKYGETRNGMQSRTDLLRKPMPEVFFSWMSWGFVIVTEKAIPFLSNFVKWPWSHACCGLILEIMCLPFSLFYNPISTLKITFHLNHS